MAAAIMSRGTLIVSPSRVRRVAGPLLAAALAGCQCPGAREADRAEIQALLAAQTEAWNAGDLGGFLAGYADGPELTFVSGGDLIEGKPALERRYAGRYPPERRGVLTFSDLRCEPLGPDVWLVLGVWSLERPPDDPHGRFTLVFRRGSEGLRIVHDHSSAADS